MAGKEHGTSTTTKEESLNPTTVPELLANVLSFATESTLVSCAVVCKPWSDIALDYLWRDLDSVFPLLELVMDIHLLEGLESSGYLGLERLSSMLSGADWSRFQFYAGRVKSLSYDDENPYRSERTPRLDPNGIALFYLHSPSGLTFLPRLRTLKWFTSESAAPMLPFLSPQLESLEVELTGSSQRVNDFFSGLAGRIPNLKSFTLKTTTNALDIESSLQRTVNLRSSRFPSKSESTGSRITYIPSYDADAMLQELPQDGFPKLKTFDFNANPASANRLVQEYSGLFARLSIIHLNAKDGVNDAEVLEFTRHLGATCPHVTRVLLDLLVDPTLQRDDLTPLSVGVLAALFPCRDLKVLEIGHPYPITLNEDDVERMAAAWPKLNTLYVCIDPDLSLPIPGDMGNSLSVLQAFARHHPMIRELGLFFAKDKTLTFSGDLWAEFEFHRLERIDVGTSAVPGGRLQDTGFLIASACKLMPEIDMGTSNWYVGIECPEWEEYQQKWEETVKHMEFAMRTKSAGRARMSGIAN
ncbi:hypothetical protein FRC04_001628 [Tulasnella sp. 424]|nr:hypothetical protein FRC04_001628 [Tulasnella sp. 424]